ncbi:MAG: isocitrate lyase/phosphoenolpyruvate mutase family protein [Alphaproteobacteria bacterium]
MTLDQQAKAARFIDLHKRDGGFVIPNPWDVGSARILEALGFEALATTSAGLAFSLGLTDGNVTMQQALEHCAALVSATSLPVSADLEKGFGDSPESVAETITAAAESGLVGCSIEDFCGDPKAPIYDFNLAVDRIAAAVETARSLPHDFVLTARSENYLRGNPDLDDTIKRLQAFEAAGADVLYAPGLPTLEDIRTLCASLTRPVNVVVGAPKAPYGVAELAEAGVTRISVGATFARLAYGEFIRAAQEIAGPGTLGFTDRAMGSAELSGYLKEPD